MKDLSTVYAFWTGLHPGKDCYKWASDKAYRDMCRTLTFRKIAAEKEQIEKQREGWRNCGTNIIKNNIINPPYDQYEKWHKFVCDELIKIYGKDKLVKKEKNNQTEQAVELTYGQAQKWLNMTLKYLWLLWRLGMIKNDENLKAFIERKFKYFHVPLDSYILRYVAKKKNKKKQEPKNIGIDGSIPYHEEYKESWSKIADYDKWYKDYQEKIRNQLLPEYDCPLEWELEHWPKALEWYDKIDEDK